MEISNKKFLKVKLAHFQEVKQLGVKHDEGVLNGDELAINSFKQLPMMQRMSAKQSAIQMIADKLNLTLAEIEAAFDAEV